LYHRSQTIEFLEQKQIIKYPPPLYAYSWKILKENERWIALRELQAINYEHFRRTLEVRTGQILPKRKTSWKGGDPYEWRSWTTMYAVERENAFKTLKVYFDMLLN
jgi:hypothetical protein